MKEILKLVFVLTLICLICTALLAAVYEKTKGPIAAAGAQKAIKAAAEVMPAGAAAPERVDVVGPDRATNVLFVARRDGAIQAVALEGRSTHGYGGDVALMVGLSADGKLVNYKVLSQKETPGLGNKIAGDLFRLPLLGRDLAQTKWQVKKDGGDIDAITAATISSRAALEAIRDAIARYDAARGQLK
jgi:electron transport complex protein RnfG